MKSFFLSYLFLFCLVMLSVVETYSQAPQSFKYQAVVRNNVGITLANQNVNLRISMLQNSATGAQVYSEQHAVITNTFGLVNLEIGNGTNVIGTFISINWSNGPYFIKIELDINGSQTFSDMGTTQLLSVPYALFAAGGNQGPTGTTGATGSQGQIGLTGVTGAIGSQGEIGPTGITGATGIQGSIGLTGLTGATGSQGLIGLTGATGADGALTAWSMTGNAGTNVAANFIGTTDANDFVLKTNNSEKMRITSFGNIGIGTTNPLTALHVNGTLSITDDTEGYGKIFTSDANGVGSWQTPVAPAIGSSVGTANYIPKFISANSLDNSLIYQNGNRIGIGTITPSGTMQLQQDIAALDTDPIFEIKDKTGQTVMVIYKDSVHFFVKDGGGTKTNNRGSFAVSGKSESKSLTNDFLRINADSTRIYTTDTTRGFGVKNIGVSSKSSYMQLTPSNYFIGHESGLKNTSGVFNSFMGYKAGINNTSGSRNIYIGFQSGYNNISGDNNVSIGNQSFFSNTIGYNNTSNGYQSLYSNIDGYNNNAFGYKALYSNLGGSSGSGSNNNAIGTNALYSNTYGNDNIAIGTTALYLNTTGVQNLAAGNNALYSNSTGWANVAIGNNTMYYNISGPSNTAVGEQSLYNNSTGGSNVSIGRWSLYYNNASSNTAVGAIAFFSITPTTYSNSTALGASTIISASNQIRLGNNSVSSIGGQVAWTTLSDGRFKKNIQENVPGLEFINKLKPVTYFVDAEAIDDFFQLPDSVRMRENYKAKMSVLQTGFVAQDVEKVAKDLGFDFSGIDKPKNEKDFYGLRYAEFTVPLVKAVQELNAKNNELQKTNEELLKRIEKLERMILIK